MSIKSIKCPNCGGQIQIEDSLEKGFCMYCGGIIMVQDEVQKIKIEHSGKVELSGKVQIDESSKANNFLCIAAHAFNVGNFQEAYDYYNKVLECDFENTYAFFRKNLCATYMSFSHIFELEKAINTRVEDVYKKSANKAADVYNVFTDVGKFLNKIFFARCNQDKDYEFEDIDQAKETFEIIAALTRLCGVCVDLITNEMMYANSKLEQEKKNYIELGICLCKKGLSEFEYLYEHHIVIETSEVAMRTDSIESPHRNLHKVYLSKFKNDYNNLPSVANALKNYEFEKTRLQNSRALYDQMIKNYFAQNPDKERRYNRKAWPLIFAVIGEAIIGLLLSFLCNSLFMALFFISGFLFLFVFSIVKGVQFKEERQKILNEMPQEIKNQKSICDENQKKFERAKQNKDNYFKNR